MHSDFPDFLTQLFIVHSEECREVWNAIGFAFAGLMCLCWVGYLLYLKREPIGRCLHFLANPRNFVPTVCLAAAVIYGGSKSNVVTPQSHSADFEQTNSSVVEPVAGQVEYWQSNSTTNQQVALFGGTVTNEFSFTAGQFIYAYDAYLSAGSYQNPTNNKLWCRHNTHSNWVASTLVDSWTPNSSNAAVIATLPNNDSPNRFALWFIGPEANLPPIIVDVTGGIAITRTVTTSKSVTFYFTGTDVRFAQGTHVFYLQSRFNRGDGIVSEWETVASTTLVGPTVSGSVGVSGYTVNVWREYRIFSDLEVAE